MIIESFSGHATGLRGCLREMIGHAEAIGDEVVAQFYRHQIVAKPSDSLSKAVRRFYHTMPRATVAHIPAVGSTILCLDVHDGHERALQGRVACPVEALS
jgi:hypothetical protein